MPNRRATPSAKSVAPTCGKAMPPHAITSWRAWMDPCDVANANRPPSFVIDATVQGMRQATPPCPHSRSSIEMIDSLESSQNSCPLCFSCHEIPWLRTRRSEEHTSELQSLMRISYAVFCLKKKNRKLNSTQIYIY